MKLGNFSDIKNVIAQGKGIRIGWKYDSTFLSTSFPDLKDDPDITRTTYLPSRSEISEVECDTQFDIDPEATLGELSLLQPSLTSCAITAAAMDPEEPHTAGLRAHRAESPIGEAATRRIRPGSAARSSERLRYVIDEIDAETKTEVLEDYPSGEIIGAALRHFFPYFNWSSIR